MGRKEDSKSAIRALSKHIEVVDESCYVTAGQIDDTPENESAITALEKKSISLLCRRQPWCTGSQQS